MLTYLLLSNGTQANGDNSCPVQRCFEEFAAHQRDLRRPTVHADLALESKRSERVTPGHLSSGACYVVCPGVTRWLRSLFKSEVRVYRRPSQVQLMRGEIPESALYWAGVVSVRLGAIAEKKVSQHSCVWGSV